MTPHAERLATRRQRGRRRQHKAHGEFTVTCAADPELATGGARVVVIAPRRGKGSGRRRARSLAKGIARGLGLSRLTMWSYYTRGPVYVSPDMVVVEL